MSVPGSQFLQSTGRALIALGVSAVLLCGLFVAYSTSQATVGVVGDTGKDILAGPITDIAGASQAVGDGIQITGFERHNNEQYAIVGFGITLNADNYPYLHYQLSNRHAGQRVNLFWRSANFQRNLSSVALHWNSSGGSTIDLAGHPDWQGGITEIGIQLTGESRAEPTAITRLALARYSGRDAIKSIWSEWTVFRGWTPRSINFLYGTPDDASVSPMLVFSAWSGLAVFMLYLVRLVTKRRKFGDYLVAIAIPWIILDLMWQRDLLIQLNETEYLFGDKTVAEKHLVDVDSHIYRYATRLKEVVLPSAAARIFIIHASRGHNFERLKMQYYLLPHNIFNFGNQPKAKAVRPGDYILALGKQPDMRFQEQQGLLSWGGGLSLSASVIDIDPQGVLYRVGPVVSISSGDTP